VLAQSLIKQRSAFVLRRFSGANLPIISTADTAGFLLEMRYEGNLRSGTETSAKGGMRVLIADDQKSVGTTLADLVTHCNHEVVEVVESGFDAIQAYTRHHPDVVVMDYWMSKLNGATACRNILARDPLARIILVSGWSPITDLTESGAVAILSKPVELNSLAEALNAAVQPSDPPVGW
jgi:two-component system, chemotaxis family, chemotaxis protein CheY